MFNRRQLRRYTARNGRQPSPAALASLALPLFLATSVALSQTDDRVLEEIVVVAQKREQNIQDVAIAITAISSEELREMTFDRTEEIVNMVPSLEVQTQGVWTIRGVGGSCCGANNREEKTSVYFDDVYWLWTASTNLQMFDMSQVEVLKGPQGTLFGRNATGGLVHFRTAEPTEEFEAYLDLQAGEYSLGRLEGAISGALSDTVRARVAFLSEDHDGWVKNRIGPDGEDMDATAIRAKIDFDIGERWSSQLGLWSTRVDAHGLGMTRWVVSSRIDPDTGLSVLTPHLPDTLGYMDPEPDNPFILSSFPHNENVIEWDIAHLKFNYDGDAISFASITSYADGWQFRREDTDQSPNDFVFVGTDVLDERFGEGLTTLSQELRLTGGTDRLIWVTGFYYLDLASDNRGAIDVGPDWFGNVCICDFGETDIESWAVFGQAEFALSDRWRLTAGIRYTEENIDEWQQALFRDLDSGEAADDGFFQRERDNDENIGARISLDYRINDDSMLYVAYNQGAKAGGFNSGTLGDASTYEDEVLNAFQFGYKSTLLEGRGTFNAEVFHYDYEDFQADTFGVVPGAGTPGDVVSATFNRDAEINGLDADLRLAAGDSLDFLFGVSLLDATVFNLSNGVLSFAERKMMRAPDYSFNAAVTYGASVGNGGRVVFHGNVRFSDDQHYAEFNHPSVFQEAYEVVNLNLKYEPPAGNWDVSVWSKNATDQIYLGCGDEISNINGTSVNCVRPPRKSGVTLRYRFQ